MNTISSEALASLSNNINVANYENMSSYTAANALNIATTDNLKYAIIDAIAAELKHQ
ncbi:hypothetical protein J6W34_08635 [bacterium]|nr:hypothetical protein [bacterium]